MDVFKQNDARPGPIERSVEKVFDFIFEEHRPNQVKWPLLGHALGSMLALGTVVLLIVPRPEIAYLTFLGFFMLFFIALDIERYIKRRNTKGRN